MPWVSEERIGWVRLLDYNKGHSESRLALCMWYLCRLALKLLSCAPQLLLHLLHCAFAGPWNWCKRLIPIISEQSITLAAAARCIQAVFPQYTRYFVANRCLLCLHCLLNSRLGDALHASLVAALIRAVCSGRETALRLCAVGVEVRRCAFLVS